MFDKCPICLDQLIEFRDYPDCFICKEHHIISICKDETVIRFDEFRFRIVQGKILFEFSKFDRQSLL